MWRPLVSDDDLLGPKLACSKPHWCAETGDQLIHLWFRGRDESSSAFGQFIHEHVTGKTTICDVDGQLVDGNKPSEMQEGQIHQLHFTFGDVQRLRVLEHKPPGDKLSQGQEWVVTVWRRLIYLGIQDGYISTASGVYVIEGCPPWEVFTITKHQEFKEPQSRHMKRAEFIDWMGGPR